MSNKNYAVYDDTNDKPITTHTTIWAARGKIHEMTGTQADQVGEKSVRVKKVGCWVRIVEDEAYR